MPPPAERCSTPPVTTDALEGGTLHFHHSTTVHEIRRRGGGSRCRIFGCQSRRYVIKVCRDPLVQSDRSLTQRRAACMPQAS